MKIVHSWSFGHYSHYTILRKHTPKALKKKRQASKAGNHLKNSTKTWYSTWHGKLYFSAAYRVGDPQVTAQPSTYVRTDSYRIPCGTISGFHPEFCECNTPSHWCMAPFRIYRDTEDNTLLNLTLTLHARSMGKYYLIIVHKSTSVLL